MHDFWDLIPAFKNNFWKTEPAYAVWEEAHYTAVIDEIGWREAARARLFQRDFIQIL